MLHLLTLTRTALLVRHWFEIDLDDASMEHGCRVELREVPSLPHRGTESAAQVVTADRPLWRADLFDRVGDPPGSFSVAHYHPRFHDVEPCDRVWDEHLSSDPWGWLEKRLRDAGTASATWPALDDEDAAELAAQATDVVAIAQQFSPARCTSTAECYRQTRDVRGAVQLMVQSLKDPGALDRAAVSLWTEN